MTVEEVRVRPEALGALIRLVDAGTISGPSAKEVFQEMFGDGPAAGSDCRRARPLPNRRSSAAGRAGQRCRGVEPEGGRAVSGGQGAGVRLLRRTGDETDGRESRSRARQRARRAGAGCAARVTAAGDCASRFFACRRRRRARPRAVLRSSRTQDQLPRDPRRPADQTVRPRCLRAARRLADDRQGRVRLRHRAERRRQDHAAQAAALPGAADRRAPGRGRARHRGAHEGPGAGLPARRRVSCSRTSS